MSPLNFNSLYATDSYVVSCTPDGNKLCSGHLDCSIITYEIDSKVKQRLATHSSVPYALS